MSRVSHAQLVVIAEGMSESEHRVIEVVAKLKLVSHAQMGRLADVGAGASPASRARMIRRLLSGLTERGVLSRLQRRIGGVRAGSAGYVYYLGPVGQRLVSYIRGDGWVRGRQRPEPGAPFVRHRLMVSELYVQTVEAERAGGIEILRFEVEPECWRSSLDAFGGRTTLKPDAFMRVAAGAYEDQWFAEVDLGTESRTVLARKAQAYVDYFHTGKEQADCGVFPRVLFAAVSDARRATLVEVLTRLPAEYWALFVVTSITRATDVIVQHLRDEADAGVSVGGTS